MKNAGRTFRRLLFAALSFSFSARAATNAVPSTLYLNTQKIRGFDPAKVNDVAANKSILRIYECLLQHSYLARPFTYEPLLAESLPGISSNNLVYTFKIRRGIYFSGDPCFTNTAGKGRELVAEDFVYSLKRLADAKNASVNWWPFEDKIKGLDTFRERSNTNAVTNYDEPIEGLRATDRYTLRIELKRPYPQLLWVLAMTQCVAVPREAVEFYGPQFIMHPVGTGPFVLKEWIRNYRLEFVKNPKWAETGRIDRYPTNGVPGDAEAGLLADAGKPLPLIDRIVEYVISDPATEWLMFLNGQIDELRMISRDNWNLIVDKDRKLLPNLAARGFQLFSGPQFTEYYAGFNMDDPILKNKKLRQAMNCALNLDDWIKMGNYRNKKPTGPIPDGMTGHATEPLPYSFDPERAKKLLAEAGYPGGKNPATGRRLELTIEVGRADSVEVRQSIELFVALMERIGIVINTSYNNWPAFMEKMENRRCQMFYLAWTADYPDAQNFLLLNYGKNCSPGPNHSNYVNPEFDALFEKSTLLPDGPERTALYKQMSDIVREDCPWIFLTDNFDDVLRQPWTHDYKYHPLAMGLEKIYRVDDAAREKFMKRGATP